MQIQNNAVPILHIIQVWALDHANQESNGHERSTAAVDQEVDSTSYDCRRYQDSPSFVCIICTSYSKTIIFSNTQSTVCVVVAVPGCDGLQCMHEHIIHTRRFAPRAAYAARYACPGRKYRCSGRREGLCLIVSANWRLENAKSDLKMPRAPPPCSRKTTRRRHTHTWVYRVCMYLVSCICDIRSICLSRSLGLYRALVAIINKRTNRHGHWLGVLD